MASVILTHLGDSVPPYLKDCVHQLRIFNPTTPVYVILDPVHKTNPEFTALDALLVFTDALVATPHHEEFRANYVGDTGFRKGFWKHVKERFFYVEELMMKEALVDVISMEYDILVYGDLTELCRKLNTLPKTIRFVMDNDTRGHPGFLYLPSLEEIRRLTLLTTSLVGSPKEDMQTLALYSQMFPTHYFPVLTEQRNRGTPNRRSQVGNTSADPFFLSEDSEALGVLFDSAVVGQWVGGIDSRNTGGRKIVNYENEGALYSIREMPFEWQNIDGRWRPILDNRLLFTIHVHSKALSCFLSDRVAPPSADYDVSAVNAGLLAN